MAKKVVSTEAVPEEMKAVRKEDSQASNRYNPVKEPDEFLKSIMDAEKKGRNQSDQIRGKIHRVPKMLRDANDFGKYYRPQVVSIGPYYYGDEKLQGVEKLKPIIVRQFLEFIGTFEKKVEFFKNFDMEIKGKDFENWYDEEATKKIDKAAGLRQMMFVDGCFILYFISCFMNSMIDNLGMKNSVVESVQQDLFLLENQLPLQVLKVLIRMTLSYYDLSLESNGEVALETWKRQHMWLKLDVDCFISIITDSTFEETPLEDETPLHLLDLIRRKFLPAHKGNYEMQIEPDLPPMKETTTKSHLFRGVKELTAAGIHLRPNTTGNIWDVKLTSHCFYGKLTLPRMTIDSSTKQTFLNMIAYEACLDKRNEFGFTSYICFLDLLIDHADDVKELRNAGILVNYLGSDEDVAKLFNEIAADLVPEVDTYRNVRLDIVKYLSSTRKVKMATWLAEVNRDHFKSPWTASAVFAAIIILAATIVQTYFTVFPRADKRN